MSQGSKFYLLPDNLETSDRYIAVPHKNDLGVGRRLALALSPRISDEYDTVAGFSGGKGIRTFQGIAPVRGILEQWYEFENRAMEEALLAWCEENGIQPVAVMVQLGGANNQGSNCEGASGRSSLKIAESSAAIDRQVRILITPCASLVALSLSRFPCSIESIVLSFSHRFATSSAYLRFLEQASVRHSPSPRPLAFRGCVDLCGLRRRKPIFLLLKLPLLSRDLMPT